jgi:autotransporter-associated beta strand protein
LCPSSIRRRTAAVWPGIIIGDTAAIGTNVTGVTQNSANSRLNLSGLNTFTADISITAGTLQASLSNTTNNPIAGALGNAQATGRTVTVGSGATLNFTAANVMGGGGSTPKLKLIANGGTIRNTGNVFNMLGPVELNGGTLSSFGGGGLFPSFTLNGEVTVGGSAVSTISTSGTNGQIGLLTAGTTFNVTDAVSGTDLSVPGMLANYGNPLNVGRLIKTGAGTMTLSGVNTYTGATTISGGTLQLATLGSLADSSSVSIAAGATMDLTEKTADSATYPSYSALAARRTTPSTCCRSLPNPVAVWC